MKFAEYGYDFSGLLETVIIFVTFRNPLLFLSIHQHFNPLPVSQRIQEDKIHGRSIDSVNGIGQIDIYGIRSRIGIDHRVYKSRKMADGNHLRILDISAVHHAA